MGHTVGQEYAVIVDAVCVWALCACLCDRDVTFHFRRSVCVAPRPRSMSASDLTLGTLDPTMRTVVYTLIAVHLAALVRSSRARAPPSIF